MNVSEIKSLQNDFVKYLVKLQNPKFRKQEKIILLDGEKTISGLIDEDIEFEYLLIKKGDKFASYKNIKNLVYVTDEILKKTSTTKSPSSVVGLIKEPHQDKNIFYKFNKIALIENIKDAGNLGTIIRSACAFGIEGIILFSQCVDLYNTKTIRSAAQNMFKIPIITIDDINFIKDLKKERRLISLVVNCDKSLYEADFSKKFIIALGSEACGLSEEIIKLSDEKLTIPMENNVESINLGICASVAFSLIKFKNGDFKD